MNSWVSKMLVDGKKIAKNIEQKMKEYIENNNLKKRLAIFYVGDNPVIDQFVKIKQNFGKRIGVDVAVFKYEDSIGEDYLVNEISDKSKDFDGVVVQLPLPSHIDRYKIINSVDLEKDVDVLSDKSYRDFLSDKNKMLPPVVFAIKEILSSYNILIKDKKVCVVGDGLLVGKPVYDWFKMNEADVNIVNLKTQDTESLIKNADILVSGVGSPNLIKKDMVKDGVVLLDAGSSQESGALVGDISKDCESVASIFSCVPGGIGPITVVGLFYNLVYN
jgi:methylenetetrahydrofolate dehydrogenase (NADP+)/methenyltetrahydrofolate cyclohydrolase